MHKGLWKTNFFTILHDATNDHMGDNENQTEVSWMKVSRLNHLHCCFYSQVREYKLEIEVDVE